MIDAIKKRVEEKLSGHQKRLTHVFGVYETAVKLAEIHHVNIEKVSIAALFHDFAKYDEIEDQVMHMDLKTIKQYAEYPVIYHAMAAAIALEHEFHVRDQEILNGIRYHVWGRPNMSDLEKIIFISDSCEPNRNFSDSEMIFEMATKDLNQATEYCMKISIDHVIAKGINPSPEQMESYHYYKEVNRGEIK
ncbi:MAG: bis(5'-nucleosyl)-tetraphosphatase (symmetrical) YqeK [Acholeplasmataceae bacterium]|nr:bis(5'-nucleosyl)-tetraphosphatase (symmetrical) YqeK [Acholeplasmataceae bacterium]